eukprot:1189761-Prorocentrum_minimum.AAC.2
MCRANSASASPPRSSSCRPIAAPRSGARPAARVRHPAGRGPRGRVSPCIALFRGFSRRFLGALPSLSSAGSLQPTERCADGHLVRVPRRAVLTVIWSGFPGHPPAPDAQARLFEADSDGLYNRSAVFFRSASVCVRMCARADDDDRVWAAIIINY